MTEAACLGSKSPPDCYEQPNPNRFQQRPFLGKPLWEICSGKRGESTAIFYAKKGIIIPGNYDNN